MATKVRAAPGSVLEPRLQRPAWASLAILFGIATAVYVALGLLQRVPLVTPDEYTYGKVSQALADGHGLSWRGTEEPLRGPLYLYVLAACWRLLSLGTAYTVAKALGAVALCSIVVPTWILAREVLSDRRTALIPCVLSVLGTWMTTSAALITENLAMPLAAGALSATVVAIVRGSGRAGLAAVALALIATATRAQLAPLAGVVSAALLLDVVLAADRRDRLRIHRAPLGVVAALAAAAIGILLISGSATLGTYSGLSGLRPSLGSALSAIAHQWLALCVMSGVLPLVVAMAGARRAWRSGPDVRALYLVAVPAVLVLVAQTGWYLAGISADWSIQRYVEYPVPLLLVAMVVLLDRGLVPVRVMLAVGAVVAASLLALPEARRVVEERAAYGLEEAVGRSGCGVALLALALTGGAALALRRAGPRRAGLVVAGLVALPLLVQSVAGWHWQIGLSRLFRQQYPADIAWVDHHGEGPVARIFVYANSPLFDNAELFSRDVATVLRSPLRWRGRAIVGGSCRWSATDTGGLTADGACLDGVKRIWNDDPLVRMSFYGGRVLARDRGLGQLIAVGPRPRIRSLIVMPCNRPTPIISPSGARFHMPSAVGCNGYLSARLFLDVPGTLSITFRGGSADQQVSREARAWTLPARRITQVRLPVTRGATTTSISTDWTITAGAPQIVAATLVTAAGTVSLL